MNGVMCWRCGESAKWLREEDMSKGTCQRCVDYLNGLRDLPPDVDDADEDDE